MPERDIILAKAKTLEGHVWVLEPEREEASWTGKAHGATFELTKPEGQVFREEGDTSSLLLTLKGNVKGKCKLRSDFVSALGEPQLEVKAIKFKSPQMLIWDATKVDQPQPK